MRVPVARRGAPADEREEGAGETASTAAGEESAGAGAPGGGPPADPPTPPAPTTIVRTIAGARPGGGAMKKVMANGRSGPRFVTPAGAVTGGSTRGLSCHGPPPRPAGPGRRSREGRRP